MKNFCLDLRGYVTKIINYKKKEMIPLTKEETRAHPYSKKMLYMQKKFSNDKKKIPYNKRFRGVAHDISNLKLVPASFYQILIFHQMIVLQKL